MWSLGVVMYIVLAGAHPFDLQNDASDEEVVKRILRGDVVLSGGAWDQVSPSGKHKGFGIFLIRQNRSEFSAKFQIN